MRKGPVSASHSSDAVQAAVLQLRQSDPTRWQLTLDDVAQELEPDQVAMLKAGHVDNLVWMESLSNTIKQLGRDGVLVVDLIPDARGYEFPVIRL